MRLSVAAESWPIAGTFTIARGSKTVAETVVATLEADGAAGRGECVPYSRYGESVDQVVVALAALGPTLPKNFTRSDVSALSLPMAAKNALDCALWDLDAKRQGNPVWQLAGLAAPTPVTTAFTLSLDTPTAMAGAARAAIARPLLKLKLGKPGDPERLAAVREAHPAARLIVDANEGWSAQDLAPMLASCARYGVELVEQPLPAAADEALRGLDRQLLVCADEFAHGLDNLAQLIGKYDAINIKLDKTGGLTPALELARAAKEAGITAMVGCMLATSLAIAPAMLLAQYASYIDLDGPLLLALDRDPSISYAASLMQPPPAALWG